jgi:hypothetical protein
LHYVQSNFKIARVSRATSPKIFDTAPPLTIPELVATYSIFQTREALQRLQRRAGCAFSVSPWYARQDRDRDHDGVGVRAFTPEALEQLKTSLAVISDTALVLGDEISIIVRSARHRLWFSHGSRPSGLWVGSVAPVAADRALVSVSNLSRLNSACPGR